MENFHLALSQWKIFKNIFPYNGLRPIREKICLNLGLNPLLQKVPRPMHIVRTILIALTGFPHLTGFLNDFESYITN